MIDEKGRRYQPKFKPDFSRDLLYSLNLITHLSVYKTDILRTIGGFRAGFEGSQDYDLALRFIEQIDDKQIRHIPHILYHWRAIRGSVALSSDEKPYAHERARHAIREHFERTGKRAQVERGIYQLHRVRYELQPENPPRVSLIISAGEDIRAAEKAVECLANETRYENVEIVLLCSEKVKNRVKDKISAQIIVENSKNKAESLNRAVWESKGEILCFVDANLRPGNADWLEELAAFAVQKEIGAVGAKLLYPDETILHGGLIIGSDSLVNIAHHQLPRGADGNLYRARVTGNFSAVSAECLAVRRELFVAQGGFDAQNLPNALSDADFCLRLGERGLRIVWTPDAELIQIERRNLLVKPSANESEFFRQKGKNVIENDPFYNQNFDRRFRALFLLPD
jgi:hypothetical protein